MRPSAAKLKSWAGTIAFVAVLAVAGFVFRSQLTSWFSGKPAESMSAQPPASATSSAATSAAGSPPIRSIEYPSMAFDALHSASDALERARAALAGDTVSGVSEAAHTIAEGAQAAAMAILKDRPELVTALNGAAQAAEQLEAAKDVEAARKAFADLNQQLLPALGADARLAKGLHVFECPMFDHARWVQRGETADNPYMGSKMLTCGTASTFQTTSRASAAAPSNPNEIDHYTCSMHPSVKQQTPGKCPICGMDLIPVTKAQQEQGVVLIDEGRRQLIGVRTAPVIEGPMQRAFRAVGHVTYDESAMTDVTLKVGGFITKLLVSRTGQHVNKGQPLFLLYSPDLYGAEQDFLLANQGAATAPAGAGGGLSRLEMLGRASRQRLHLLGLSDGQIDAMAKKGVPSESISIPSPASGFVIEKDVVEGASVEAGMRLYRIAALNKVWVEAEVYEADLARVQVGQDASVTLDYLPGRSYEAKVSYIYPYLNPEARTGRVRVELMNKDLELRPGMYASVTLSSGLSPRLQVPAAAVVYTGPRRLVFVDLGEGRFRPQEVRLGTEANGMYEVLAGLAAGDRVATSGVFLIAAEARISTAAKYWDRAPDDDAMPSIGDTAAPAMPSSAPSPAPAPMPMPPPMKRSPAAAPRGMAAPSAPATTVYTCPMHPEVRSNAPGKCPKCGMDLVPAPSGGGK
jgi:membrane fusion protein, copper/silver efflux system